MKIGKHIERWLPLTVATAVGIIAFSVSYRTKLDINEITEKLFPNTINLGGIVIGFLAAAKSILFSIEEGFIMRQIRKAEVYKKLINYFMDAINLGFLLVIFSIVGTLINFENPLTIHHCLFGVWVALLVNMGLSSYRVIKIFADILKDS